MEFCETNRLRLRIRLAQGLYAQSAIAPPCFRTLHPCKWLTGGVLRAPSRCSHANALGPRRPWLVGSAPMSRPPRAATRTYVAALCRSSSSARQCNWQAPAFRGGFGGTESVVRALERSDPELSTRTTVSQSSATVPVGPQRPRAPRTRSRPQFHSWRGDTLVAGCVRPQPHALLGATASPPDFPHCQPLYANCHTDNLEFAASELRATNVSRPTSRCSFLLAAAFRRRIENDDSSR